MLKKENKSSAGFSDEIMNYVSKVYRIYQNCYTSHVKCHKQSVSCVSKFETEYKYELTIDAVDSMDWHVRLCHRPFSWRRTCGKMFIGHNICIENGTSAWQESVKENISWRKLLQYGNIA